MTRVVTVERLNPILVLQHSITFFFTGRFTIILSLRMRSL
jgi:hypothetical protein